MVTIYKINCLANEKSYIGITEDFERRLAMHWSRARTGNQAVLCKAIRKYGENNFNVKIIDKVETWEEACKREIYYIKNLKTKIPNGYNMTDGGEGTLGLLVSEKVKQKLSIAHKGLQVGEKHGSAKVTEQDVLTIRKRYKTERISSSQLAEKYGVKLEQIYCIISGKSWSHIPEGILSSLEIKERASFFHESCEGEKNGASKLTKKEVNSIRKLYKKGGITIKHLSKKFDVCISTIQAIISNKLWSHLNENTLTPLEIKKRKKALLKGKQEGEKNGCAKLTEQGVIKIRRLYNDTELSQEQLAKQFGITQRNIGCIVSGKSWGHVKEGIMTSEELERKTATARKKNQGSWTKENNPSGFGEQNKGSKLTESNVIDIRKRYKKGNITLATLANEFGVNLSNIHYIIKRKSWAHI